MKNKRKKYPESFRIDAVRFIIVGWSFHSRMGTSLIPEALETAWERRDVEPGKLIFSLRPWFSVYKSCIS
jgi:hypothetical protein